MMNDDRKGGTTNDKMLEGNRARDADGVCRRQRRECRRVRGRTGCGSTGHGDGRDCGCADGAVCAPCGKTLRCGPKAAKKAARDAKKAEEKREKKARYKTLFVDNGFTYYLDSKNSRWVLRPNSGRERMIEAWVRLVENTTGGPVAEDGKVRPNKYFLEHYYISPERREIMFISELEVTGRPENAVKERPYDAANWEQLVPGSIEDDLFDAIVAKMKQAPGERSGVLSGTSGMSLRDMVEEFARISL